MATIQRQYDKLRSSKPIIRQTLSQLAERGLISKDARSHWTVGPLTSKRLNDLFMIRSKLEPMALGDAAQILSNSELTKITNTKLIFFPWQTFKSQLTMKKTVFIVALYKKSGFPFFPVVKR